MRIIHGTRHMTSVVSAALLIACSSAHSGSDSKAGQNADSAVTRSVSSAAIVPIPVASVSASSSEAMATVVPVSSSSPEPPPIPAPNHIVQVVGADSRACAIFDNGMLQCWGGINSYGELGHGHTGRPTTPNWVKGLYAVKKLSMSSVSTCAIVGSGELYCWGENLFFDTDSRLELPRPIRVQELSDVVDVAVSSQHGCAVVRRGAVYCWGRNDEGQLGFGTSSVARTYKRPMLVKGIVDAVGIAVSTSSTLAWTKNGDLYRWGTASDEKRSYAYPAPTKLNILSGVKKAEMSMQQACVLLETGEVRCFGHETLEDFLAGKEHDFGPDLAKLASALAKKKVLPIPKKYVFPEGRGLSGVLSLAVFNHDASAVTDKGEVFSWGSAERGTVGRPDRTKGFFPPTRIQGFTQAVAIAGTFRHRCALETNGEVRCFGDRRFLGVEVKEDSTSAVVVKGLPKIVHLASNGSCTFALAEDHSLWAWGDNTQYACGGVNDERKSPLPELVHIEQRAP